MNSQTRGQEAVDSLSLAQDAANKWGQEEIVKLQKHCATKGIRFTGLDQKLSLHIPPVIGLWYILSDDKSENFWGISGEFPTDIAPANCAKDPRDACRFFSLSWQLKAARMEEAMAEGKVDFSDKETQEKIIADLVSKAERLFQIYNDDNLWAGSGYDK